MLTNVRFQLRFLRARLKEIAGNFEGAAAVLENCAVPPRFQSLRDAYRLRMLVLASDVACGPDVIRAAHSYDWFLYPKSDADRYAADYCRYVSAGVSGSVEVREALEQKLMKIPVRNIYRHSLPVMRLDERNS